MLALIYLLKSPINIESIVLTNGANNIDKGYLILKKILYLLNKSHIPIILGSKENKIFISSIRNSAEKITNNYYLKKIPIKTTTKYYKLNYQIINSNNNFKNK
ncbi:MAG: hypothetical protein ACK4FL_02620 [Microgenomates group bacterium]